MNHSRACQPSEILCFFKRWIWDQTSGRWFYGLAFVPNSDGGGNFDNSNKLENQSTREPGGRRTGEAEIHTWSRERCECEALSMLEHSRTCWMLTGWLSIICTYRGGTVRLRCYSWVTILDDRVKNCWLLCTTYVQSKVQSASPLCYTFLI